MSAPHAFVQLLTVFFHGQSPIILGIETSCDETAAALVDGERRILSHALWSQIEAHALYGGVVPEIAARAHVDHLDHLIRKALLDAEMKLADVDAIAATAGPGLIGGVMVGVVTAKALAFGANKPSSRSIIWKAMLYRRVCAQTSPFPIFYC